MSLILAAALVLQTPARIEAWEKPLASGLSYRMEYDPAGPWLIHALRYAPSSPAVRARPELGSPVVYRDDANKGRGTLSEMVAASGAVAGINADFFPFTGDPLGLMVRDGELVSEPNPTRSAMAWGATGARFGLSTMSARLTAEGVSPIVIDGINEDCPENAIILNTTRAGLALAKKPNLVGVLRVANPVWSPSAAVEATFEFALPDGAPLPVQEDQAILVARGTKQAQLASLKPGAPVRIEFRTEPFDWERMDQAVGGGPQLVKDGKRAITAEGFNEAFTARRHPRTMAGRTASGDLLFVAVDGRQKLSAGLTLEEAASLMLRLGCSDAINLDGGGSTTFHILGATLNRPSDGRERPVANGVLFFGPKPTPGENLTIELPKTVAVGRPMILAVRQGDRRIPARQVLWASSGDGWVDQAGRLRIDEAGTVQVTATVGGTTVAVSVVVPPATPPARGSRAQPARAQSPRKGL